MGADLSALGGPPKGLLQECYNNFCASTEETFKLPDYETNIQELDSWEALKQFGVTADKGLSPEEAEQRLVDFGENEILTPESINSIVDAIKYSLKNLALKQFTGPMTILIPPAAKALWDSNFDQIMLIPLIGIPIFAIFLFIFIFIYLPRVWGRHDFEADSPADVTVTRGGESCEVSPILLVPGDIVQLQYGMQVPADMRILECSRDFEVDMSALTGEAEPQRRTSDTVSTGDLPIECRNLLFAGTLVLRGKGKGLVYKTGKSTIMGNLCGIAGDSPMYSPFDVYLVHCLRSHWSLVFFTIFISSLSMSFVYSWEYCTMFAAVIIPTFMASPILIARDLVLWDGERSLRENQILPKKVAYTLGTLAKVNAVCIDKTGTITTSRMTVVYVVVDDEIVKIDAETGLPESRTGTPSLNKFLTLAVLATKSEEVSPGKWSSDPTSIAIARFALSNMDDLRKTWKEVFFLPFNSKNKYDLHVFRDSEGADVVCLKGAPWKIVDFCTKVFWEGEIVAMTEERKESIKKRNEELAKKGVRVLALAGFSWYAKDHTYNQASKIEECKDFPVEELMFVGLVGMIDPPARGAREFINDCLEEGMEITMLTGDHPTTAETVAREVGIIPEGANIEYQKGRQPSASETSTEYDGVIFGGSALREALEEDDGETFQRIFMPRKYKVFARTSPRQKLKIVEYTQSKADKIVMMLGDGVNDSPAIKKSDLGVAVLPCATQVTMTAADMVLTGNLSNINTAVQTSRWADHQVCRLSDLEYIFSVSLMFPIPIFVLFGINIDWFAFVAVIFNFFAKACVLL